MFNFCSPKNKRITFYHYENIDKLTQCSMLMYKSVSESEKIKNAFTVLTLSFYHVKQKLFLLKWTTKTN